MNQKSIKKLRSKANSFMASVVLILFVMATGWFADSVLDAEANLWESLKASLGGIADNPGRLGFPFILLVGSAAILYYLRRGLLPAQNLAKLERVPASRALVFTLSELHPSLDFDWSSDGAPLLVKTRNLDGGATEQLTYTLPETLEDAVVVSESNPLSRERVNWQQILKGLMPHRSTVKCICFVTSTKSHHGLEKVSRLTRYYLKQNVEIVTMEAPVNFEVIDEVYGALSGLIEKLEGAGYSDRKIMIDATGGNKVTSIATALATLTYKELKFQYVSEQGTPVAFNTTFANEPDLG